MIEILTPRQQEIVACLELGMTNDEIADELHVARSTVKAHLSAVFERLGVSNRTEAAVAALRLKERGRERRPGPLA
ncbi:MAG: LuxR C-terminal-related transcriptional regulator [Actinomycetota bacterium]